MFNPVTVSMEDEESMTLQITHWMTAFRNTSNLCRMGMRVSWIGPIIDSNHPDYDINDRILGVDKNRCFIELADILMFRFLRWNTNNRKSNKRVTFPATLNMNKYVWNADGVNDSHNKQYPHFD
eukprot:522067_1